MPIGWRRKKRRFQGRTRAALRAYKRRGRGSHDAFMMYKQNPYTGSISQKGFFKLRYVALLETDGGGTGTINTVRSINDPSAAEDWSSIASLYDSYRVSAIKVEGFPLFDFTTEAAASLNGYMTIYADFDSTASTTTNLATAIQYENARFVEVKRRWTYMLRYVPRITGSENGTNSIIYQGGFMDMADPIDVGRIFFYAENLTTTASTDYIRVVFTYYITCKNRR